MISSIFELGGFEDARAVIEARATQRASRARRIRSELRTIDRAFEGVDLLYLYLSLSLSLALALALSLSLAPSLSL